jgi:uncharacterized protein YccT (UPF0319 family)
VSKKSIPKEFFQNANPENKVIVSSLEQRADDFAKSMNYVGLAAAAEMHSVGLKRDALDDFLKQGMSIGRKRQVNLDEYHSMFPPASLPEGLASIQTHFQSKN